jgi:hypothetical protein
MQLILILFFFAVHLYCKKFLQKVYNTRFIHWYKTLSTYNFFYFQLRLSKLWLHISAVPMARGIAGQPKLSRSHRVCYHILICEYAITPSMLTPYLASLTYYCGRQLAVLCFVKSLVPNQVLAYSQISHACRSSYAFVDIDSTYYLCILNCELLVICIFNVVPAQARGWQKFSSNQGFYPVPWIKLFGLGFYPVLP